MGILDGVIGDALGAIGNVIGVGMTNKANKKLARETNALNYQMFQEGNEFNERMWNLQNEYNTPSAQRARLEAAGYSPYLLAGSNQLGGVSQSSPSAAHSNPAVSPTLQSPDFSMLGNIAGDIAQMALAKKYTQESKGQSIDNEYKRDRNIAEIKALNAKGKLDDATTNKMIQDIAFKDATWNAQEKMLEQQSYEQYEKAQMAKLQREVYQEFGSMEMTQRINNLIQEGLLLVQKGETEKALQLFHKTGANKNVMDAVSNRIGAYAASTSARANMISAEAGAAEANERTAYQRMVNSVYQVFGKAEEAARFLTQLEDLKGQQYENIEAYIQSEVSKHTKHTRQFGEHMRNILGWIPFIAIPIGKITPNKRPVVGGFSK